MREWDECPADDDPPGDDDEPQDDGYPVCWMCGEDLGSGQCGGKYWECPIY